MREEVAVVGVGSGRWVVGGVEFWGLDVSRYVVGFVGVGGMVMELGTSTLEFQARRLTIWFEGVVIHDWV